MKCGWIGDRQMRKKPPTALYAGIARDIGNVIFICTTIEDAKGKEKLWKDAGWPCYIYAYHPAKGPRERKCE